MKLNHMNLVVTNIAETATFFEKYFHFTCEKMLSDVIAILKGEDGFVLVLSNIPKTATFEYPADFHIGFYQENPEAVIELLNKLKADGIALEQEAKKIRDRFGFYFYAPGGILTEITCAAGE